MKPGLTKLQRASLRRERERERAEAGREPGSSGLRLPKYWDYKRAPPRPAFKYNFCTKNYYYYFGLALSFRFREDIAWDVNNIKNSAAGRGGARL